METVFDYNIIPQEWEYIHGNMPQESYFAYVSSVTAIADIVALFYLRGDEKRAEEYAAKLPMDIHMTYGEP